MENIYIFSSALNLKSHTYQHIFPLIPLNAASCVIGNACAIANIQGRREYCGAAAVGATLGNVANC